MKKGVLTIAITLLVVFSVVNFAYGEKIILKSTNGLQNVGKTFSVTSAVYNIVYGNRLSAFDFKLNYDPAYLEVVNNSVYGQVYADVSVNTGNFRYILAYPGPANAITQIRDLTNIKFKTKQAGNTSITLSDALIGNYNGTIITPTLENLTITICNEGDVNGDGVVNIGDLAIVSNKVGTKDEICDLNEDGVVNKLDVDIIINLIK